MSREHTTTPASSALSDNVRLRVVVVTESFLPTVNGVTRSVASVVRELERSGHEVAIIAPSPGPARWGSTEVVRLPSVPLPWATGFPLGVPTGRMEAALRRLGPDAVHLASPVLLGARAASVCRDLGIPTVAIYQTDVAGFAADHGLIGAQPYLWWWLRRIHNSCARTLAPSRAAVADLRIHGIERWGRGVDGDAFAPTHRGRRPTAQVDRVQVGYIGRLSSEKRVNLLHLLVDLPGVDLVVVGDGDDRARLERLLPTARFTGQLHGPALSRIYADLDVFVHTGLHETFCQAVQEALASGVPVVAPASGGPLDLVRHGRTGFLWDPLRPMSLRDEVARLVTDPDLRRRQGIEARRSVTGRSWAALTDELVGHYLDAMAAPPLTTRTAA